MMDEKEKDLLVGSVLALCGPEQIILYGAKHGMSSGKLKTANLCIIVSACDREALLRRLYLEFPLDFQVTISIYTTAQWDELRADPHSHASWIAEKGTVLYGA